MEKYDYYDAVKEDVLNAIKEDDELLPREDEDRTDYEERLTDALWASKVTVKGPFVYYFKDEEDAIAAIMTNLDLCREAYQKFELDVAAIMTNLDLCREAYQKFELDVAAVTFMLNICSADATIRCYILSSVIHNIIEEKPWFNDEEED